MLDQVKPTQSGTVPSASYGAPLRGLRIADFTLHAAGPFCTQILSMLGAECIKIETAGRLDIFRKPHPVYGRMEAATFDQVSSGKRSIRLNLKQAAGLALAKRLVRISDIVAESFRPGVMKRLGLDYATLRALKPEVVMVSVSAAGQRGPDSGHAGYAPLFGAAGGLGALTGYEDGPPVEVRHVMDHSAGLAAAVGTLAAVIARRRSGVGQHVDLAARDVGTSFIGDALLYQAVTGKSLRRQGNDMKPRAPHNVYPCSGADSWVSISVGDDEQWKAFVVACGEPSWASDPRFATQASRWDHRHTLDDFVADWTHSRDGAEIAERLQALDVGAFPSYTTMNIATDAHLLSRGVVRSAHGPNGAERKVVGPPWVFEKTQLVPPSWTPELGEGNNYVFGELLGLSTSEIATLIEEKVIW